MVVKNLREEGIEFQLFHTSFQANLQRLPTFLTLSVKLLSTKLPMYYPV